MGIHSEKKTSLILVVDDDAVMRMLARAALEREGYVVREAQTGEEALALLATLKPDLILLDVMMPGIDGFAVCEQAHRLAGQERLPVCMMTGLDDTASIHRAYQAGATDFVTKPIDWLILGYRVRYILRAGSALEDLYRAESKSRAILGAIPDAMLRISREGRVIEARCPAGSGLRPVTQEDKVDIYEILPAPLACELMGHVGQALDGGGVRVFECSRMDGGRLIEWEIRTVGSGDGETLSVVRDISERKRTEKALRESEERYALASLAANDGLWDWDLRTGEVHYSVRWKGLLGFGEEEIGKGIEEWFSRIHPDDVAQVKVEIKSNLDGISAHFSNEHRMLHRDGAYRWILSRGIALRDEAGRAYRMAGSQTDISDQKQAEEQLLHDALHDGLTGLPNRTLFMDRLASALRRTRRAPDYLCAVLFLDMNRFKVINDSLGHRAGDAVLIETARRLERCSRPGDTVARLGGDEFVMLLDDIKNVENAKAVTERVQSEFAKPVFVGGTEVINTASIGIALGSSEHQGAEELLQDADITMYHAKGLGNGRYEIFEPAMRQQAMKMLQLENDLRGAVERNELRLHYQPIVCLEDSRILGLEALLRWEHPQRGLLAPQEFIPLAEETELIIPIGEWVLQTACTQLKNWNDEGLPRLRLSVNVSAVQLRDSHFAERVAAVVGGTGFDPRWLELEITETSLMENGRDAVDALTRLKAMGMHISLDDFGTGYSSLNYLQSLPIDTLKIDRSFMSSFSSDGEQRKIVETIMMLGSKLGIGVVAEGIETQEQRMNLQKIHCPNGQGFLFAKPMEADGVRSLLSLTPPG